MPPARRTRRQAQASQASQGEASGSDAPIDVDDGSADEQAGASASQTRSQNGRQKRQASVTTASRSRHASSTRDGTGDSTVRADTPRVISRGANDEDDEQDENHIKIMLATDNHVGYMEKDPVRGRDSINTFREILQLAVEHDVDFILLGGDLFHENRPSRTSMHQVMGALREYTLGDKPVSVELLSDPNDGQPEGYNFPAINYEDSNLNVAIPVFSIHGNHDDPQGIGSEGALSAVDLLSVSGLMNYFGKVELPSSDSLAQQRATEAPSKGGLSDVGIRIRPVLLQKGTTKIALYGMGNIKDERMHYELRSNRVRMYRPQEDSNSWFNILAIHQNRVGHDPKAVVPETMFDDSIDLVIWGHEHEQRLAPELVTGKDYKISQPGSSVATSLMPGEAVDKKVGIIHVRGRDYKIEPLDLKTVRPFVEEVLDFEQMLEKENVSLEEKPKLNKIMIRQVNGLIERARQQWQDKYGSLPDDDKPEWMLPLVRLRVSYDRLEAGTFVRFGQNFVDKVANPKDILHFTKKKAPPKKRKDDKGVYNAPEEGDGMVASEKLEKTRMSDLIKKYLRAQTLQLLDPTDLDKSVTLFVDKDDNSAIPSVVRRGLKSTRDGLVKTGSDESRLNAELDKIAEARRNDKDRGHEDGDDGSEGDRARDAFSDEDDDFLNLGMDEDPAPSRGSKSKAAHAKKTTTSRATPARSQARGKASAAPTQSKLVFRGNDGDSDDGSESGLALSREPSTSPATTRGNGRAAASKSTTSRTRAPAPTQARTGGRAAAQRASTRLVESQAQDADEDDDFEMIG